VVNEIGFLQTITVDTVHEFILCRRFCVRCQAPTPDPTTEWIRDHMRDHAGNVLYREAPVYLWPFEAWWPEGWLEIHAQDTKKYLCAGCASDTLTTMQIAW
jgi:hypothetical protein